MQVFNFWKKSSIEFFFQNLSLKHQIKNQDIISINSRRSCILRHRLSWNSAKKFDILVGSIRRITIKLLRSEGVSLFLALPSRKARSVWTVCDWTQPSVKSGSLKSSKNPEFSLKESISIISHLTGKLRHHPGEGSVKSSKRGEGFA